MLGRKRLKGMEYLKVGVTNREVWVKFFKTLAPCKGLVIVGTGSGEVRSVDDDSHEEICAWLMAIGWDCIVYDKYGCGESDGDWKSVTFNDLRDDLIILADFFRPQVSGLLVILGHSESSILAVEAAEKSSSIDALVLRVASHQNISDRIKMQLGYEKWARWISDLSKAADEGRYFVASHPVSYWKSRMDRTLTGDLVLNLQIPVLALNGSQDTFTPERAFNSLHEAVRLKTDGLSRAVQIPEVGHSLRAAHESFESSQAAMEISQFLDALDSKAMADRSFSEPAD